MSYILKFLEEEYKNHPDDPPSYSQQWLGIKFGKEKSTISRNLKRLKSLNQILLVRTERLGKSNYQFFTFNPDPKNTTTTTTTTAKKDTTTTTTAKKDTTTTAKVNSLTGGVSGSPEDVKNHILKEKLSIVNSHPELFSNGKPESFDPFASELYPTKGIDMSDPDTIKRSIDASIQTRPKKKPVSDDEYKKRENLLSLLLKKDDTIKDLRQSLTELELLNSLPQLNNRPRVIDFLSFSEMLLMDATQTGSNSYSLGELKFRRSDLKNIYLLITNFDKYLFVKED